MKGADTNVTTFRPRPASKPKTYFNIFVLAFSAFFLWMNSIRTRLFLKTLPRTKTNIKTLDYMKHRNAQNNVIFFNLY